MSLMLKKINKISKTDIVIVLFLLAIITLLINGERKRKSIKDDSRYTIGTTIRMTNNRFGQSFVYYKYFVGGEEVISSQSYEKIIVKKKQQYYIVFQNGKPKNSRLLLDKPIIGNVDSIPLNGWEKLPQLAVE